MATVVLGMRAWGGSRDEEGHREYFVTHRVRCLSTEGPASVMVAAGLPIPGGIFAFDADVDPWAWCRGTRRLEKAQEIKEGDPITHWDVTSVFSTKPPSRNVQRCNDTQIEDPLLEPPRISGSYSRYQEEAQFDRTGVPIRSSSHEMLRGPQNEWDANRPTVRIEQNVSSLSQAVSLPASMADTLNDAPMWGLPVRTIKLTPGPWEKRYFGQCFAYYNRVLEFEIKYDGWDRDLLDEGTKVLNGHWDEASGEWILDDIDGAAPDPDNPSHFIKAVDKVGNPISVLLDGAGKPANVDGRLISAIEFGAPSTITTAAAHDLTTGDQVLLAGLKGQQATGDSLDGVWTVTVTGATTFTLDDNDSFGVSIANIGRWYKAGDGSPGYRHVERYASSNFLLLGIPSSI